MNVCDLVDKYSKKNSILHKYRDRSISYEELIKKSDALASYIINRSSDNKLPIIVCGHKEPLMLVCFRACTKSRHIYLPIDSSTPKERIKDIAKDSNAQMIFNVSKNNLHLDNIDVKNCEDIKIIINSNIKIISNRIYRVKFDINKEA